MQLRPYDSRMWLAVGKCFSMLKKIDYAISSYKRAYRHQDAEGIAAYELGKLFQDKWKKNKSDSESRTKAANWYEKHVEMHDNVGGHGYSQYQESLLFLGRYYFEEKDYNNAEIQCRKLQATGSHQESEEAKALLRDIRAAQQPGAPGNNGTLSNNIFDGRQQNLDLSGDFGT